MCVCVRVCVCVCVRVFVCVCVCVCVCLFLFSSFFIRHFEDPWQVGRGVGKEGTVHSGRNSLTLPSSSGINEAGSATLSQLAFFWQNDPSSPQENLYLEQ